MWKHQAASGSGGIADPPLRWIASFDTAYGLLRMNPEAFSDILQVGCYREQAALSAKRTQMSDAVGARHAVRPHRFHCLAGELPVDAEQGASENLLKGR